MSDRRGPRRQLQLEALYAGTIAAARTDACMPTTEAEIINADLLAFIEN